MTNALVGVIIGSRSDFNVMRRGLETLRVMGVPYVFEVASPQRAPERLVHFARTAGESGIEVIIVGAGGASALPTLIATYTTLPIIGVPIDASPLRGQDSLYSIVQAPVGLPIATVGINNSENAALLATQILALKYAHFREVLAHRRMQGTQRADSVMKDLCQEYPDLCIQAKTAPGIRAGSDNDTDGGAGPEDRTPTPPPGNAERIRPGAILTGRAVSQEVGHLVSTPVPHEPGHAPRDRDGEFLPLQFDPPGTTSWRRIASEEKTPEPDPNAAIVPPPPPPPPPRPAERPSTPVPVLLPSEPPIPPAGTIPLPPPVAPQQSPEQAGAAPESPPVRARRLSTKLFKVSRTNPEVDIIEHAMMVLLEGGIVALPTDTVYGLAVDATNKDAVSRLYDLKGKGHQKPMGVLIHSLPMLERIAREIPPDLESVLAEFWPGALTVILPKSPSTLSNVSDSSRIGVRVPNDMVALAVISMVARPIATMNATRGAADAPPTTAKAVLDQFSGEIECVLDGGACQQGEASTVLSALTTPFEILREGAIKREDLKRHLGPKLKDPR